MIEILSSELSQAIQLVGLLRQGKRLVPSRVLFAIVEEKGQGEKIPRGLWLVSNSLVSVEALEDLVREWYQGPGEKACLVQAGKCSVCGVELDKAVGSIAGRTLCWEHLAGVWEELLVAQLGGGWTPGRCAGCGLEGVFCWEDRGYCTRCLVQTIRNLPGPQRWILVAGPPLPGRGKGELRAFLEAWRRVGACPRCASRAIRVRRLLMDFPRAQGPLFPVWEITRQDMSPERIMWRERQLRVFTEGLLRVTVECPQCGYMDLEFPGAGSWAQGDDFFLQT